MNTKIRALPLALVALLGCAAVNKSNNGVSTVPDAFDRTKGYDHTVVVNGEPPEANTEKPKANAEANPASALKYRQGLEAYLGGDSDRAMNLWEESLDLDPLNDDASRAVAKILQSREPKSPEGRPEYLYREGLIAYAKGRRKLAILLWEGCLQYGSECIKARAPLERAIQEDKPNK